MIGIPEAAAPLDPWLGTSILEIKHDILNPAEPTFA
jgi:hypothetical protein